MPTSTPWRLSQQESTRQTHKASTRMDRIVDPWGMGEVRRTDWRNSPGALTIYCALIAFGLFWPRPHAMTVWQNVAIDAVLIAAVVWMAWPAIKRLTTP